MPASRPIIVAGAGAVGSTVAYVLARAGHAVTVVDPADLGANASGVAAGMLAPAFEALFDPEMAERFNLLAEARDAWPALAAEIGLPLAQEGAIAVGDGAQTQAWAQRLADMGADAAFVELASGAGVFSPEDWRLEARDALAALRRGAETYGARFEVGQVDGLAAGDALLVLATGAATRLAVLVAELRRLTPVKGHILRAAVDVGPGPVLRAPGVYLCRASGELILGASMEPGRDDLAVDPAVVARLLDDALPLTADLGEFAWRAATGLRAATPDGLPMVGPSQTPGVILAVGARRNGWLLAPMIAGVVLDAVEGRPNGKAALFDPARFSRPGVSPD